jgi:hypothetical protein
VFGFLSTDFVVCALNNFENWVRLMKRTGRLMTILIQMRVGGSVPQEKSAITDKEERAKKSTFDMLRFFPLTNQLFIQGIEYALTVFLAHSTVRSWRCFNKVYSTSSVGKAFSEQKREYFFKFCSSGFIIRYIR